MEQERRLGDAAVGRVAERRGGASEGSATAAPLAVEPSLQTDQAIV